ncbi:MAG: hypothetical protein WCD35_18435 [Mycobacteriales bacterium]
MNGGLINCPDVPGLPRADGRPAGRGSGSAADAPENGQGGAVARFSGNGTDQGVENPVSPVARFSGNGHDSAVDNPGLSVARNPGSRDAGLPGSPAVEPEFPQVSAVARFSGNGLSTAPSRDLGVGQVQDLSLPTTGPQGTVRVAEVVAFCRDERVLAALAAHRGEAIRELAAAFADADLGCEKMRVYLNAPQHCEGPHWDLAHAVVDLLGADGAAYVETAEVLRTHLRSRGVRKPPAGHGVLLVSTVVAAVTALDSEVQSPAGGSARPSTTTGGRPGGSPQLACPGFRRRPLD